MAATASQARELGVIAREKRLVLYAYQNRRWDSDFLALKRLLALLRSLWALSQNSPLSKCCLFCLHADLTFSSYDDNRPTLKGTWKDEALPAAGLTFALGVHIIDQALVLFGRPRRLTAFIQNLRGIGNPDVDDSVSDLCQAAPNKHLTSLVHYLFTL